MTPAREQLLALLEDAIPRFSQPDEIVSYDILWTVQGMRGPDGQMMPMPVPMVLLASRGAFIGAAPNTSIRGIEWYKCDQKLMDDAVMDLVSNLRAATASQRKLGN